MAYNMENWQCENNHRLREMNWLILIAVCFMLYCLPSVIPQNSRLRYYSCYVTYGAVVLTGSLFVIPLKLIMGERVCSIVVKIAIYISNTLGIKWEARNKSVLDRHKNAVIVLNHQSMLDFLGSMMTFRPITNYSPVMKKEMKYIFPFGQVMMLFNAAFIDRKKNAHQAISILRDKLKNNVIKSTVIDLMGGVRKDCSLIIHPEGTRNPKGEPFLPFKKGGFRIAVELGLPIIPVVISPYYFIKDRKFSGGRIIYSFMEPVETTNVDEENITEFVDKIRANMENEFIKLKEEVMADTEDNKHK